MEVYTQMLTRTTKRLSLVLFWATILLASAILSLSGWLIVAPADVMGVYAQTVTDPAEVSDGAWRALTLAWLIGPALALVLLWHMGALFRLFADGQGLSPDVLHHVQGAGRVLLVMVAYRLIMRPFEGVIMALWPTGTAQNSMVISFSSQDVMMALGGVLLLLIGRVLIEAQRAVDENKAFV